MTILSDKHIALTSANEVSQLIKPLEVFHINHFVYVKGFKDGSHINLCNRPEWTKTFYNDQYYKKSLFEDKPENYQSGYILWNTLADQEVFRAARVEFHLEDGITIIKKGDKCCEFFYIGTTTRYPELNNIFLNNLDLLNRFILYFRERGKNLILQATKKKILLPTTEHLPQQNKNIEIISNLNIQALKKQFIRDTKIKHYYLNNDQPDVSFSNREIDCLKLLFEGKTANEAGNRLFISPRTVEKHIESIREKLGCHKKSAIIETLLKNGFGFYGDHSDIFI